jgi:hypothetical protein
VVINDFRDLAKIVSNILYPYAILSLVVAIVAYQQSLDQLTWINWMVVALLLAYLFPFAYRQIKVAIPVYTTRAQINLHPFFREQPIEIVILVYIFSIASAPIFSFLKYPVDVIAMLFGVVVATLLIALINRVYRASFHMTLFTNAIIPLTIIFGVPALAAVPCIFLLGASRYSLDAHTRLQLTLGFFTWSCD